MVRAEPAAWRRWSEPAVLTLAIVAMASGFGQFGAVSALGDVARSFGHIAQPGHRATVAETAGLSGTELGLGLAVLRLASLAGMPLAALADRVGRRRVLVGSCTLGLAFTIAAAVSPSYWMFVGIFALGRPFLSATNAVAQVGAAEETRSAGRAKAVAIVAAGYGIGSGLTAVVYGLAGRAFGFRGVFALAVVPLVTVAMIGGRVRETDRYLAAAGSRTGERLPVLGSVGAPLRRRLFIVCALAFSVAVVSGPANSFVFIYAENVEGLSRAFVAMMVVVAGIFGFVGLLLGRFLADRIGRRVGTGIAMVAMVVAAITTYSGGRLALIGGYETGVLAAGALAPAAGALVNELFPTSARASVAGWNVAASVAGAVLGLLAFGAIADVGGRFSVGALATFLPVLATTALLLALPETRGSELEELWPEHTEDTGAVDGRAG